MGFLDYQDYQGGGLDGFKARSLLLREDSVEENIFIFDFRFLAKRIFQTSQIPQKPPVVGACTGGDW